MPLRGAAQYAASPTTAMRPRDHEGMVTSTLFSVSDSRVISSPNRYSVCGWVSS